MSSVHSTNALKSILFKPKCWALIPFVCIKSLAGKRKTTIQKNESRWKEKKADQTPDKMNIVLRHFPVYIFDARNTEFVDLARSVKAVQRLDAMKNTFSRQCLHSNWRITNKSVNKMFILYRLISLINVFYSFSLSFCFDSLVCTRKFSHFL